VSDPEPSGAEQALARAAQAGIHPLSIPTPFLVGRVNCYLIEDEPLTLVDTGPNSGTSLDTLERALAGHGRRIEDLQLIVLTHQHMDHIGLLKIITRRSGAEVAAFAPLAPWLADYREAAAADDAYADAVMQRHGVPGDLASVLALVGAAFRQYGSPGTVTIPLLDGATLPLRDRSFTIFHRPGHSPSDIVLWDEQRSLLVSGDHLLAHISSNPLIHRPLGPELAERPRPLIDYIASMRATAELPATLVLGGHGEPITDHRSLIAERIRVHERRARKILGILAERPLSAHEVATRMWGNVAVTQAYLTLSEVLGHMDLLLAEGQVVQEEDGATVVFRAV
jgi:glyoxylase-like metal-dependent hydrolase (beta-lactamase superfamily II)